MRKRRASTKRAGWEYSYGGSTSSGDQWVNLGTFVNAYLTDQGEGVFWLEVTQGDKNPYSDNGKWILRSGRIYANSFDEAIEVANQEIEGAGYKLGAAKRAAAPKFGGWEITDWSDDWSDNNVHIIDDGEVLTAVPALFEGAPDDVIEKAKQLSKAMDDNDRAAAEEIGDELNLSVIKTGGRYILCKKGRIASKKTASVDEAVKKLYDAYGFSSEELDSMKLDSNLPIALSDVGMDINQFSPEEIEEIKSRIVRDRYASAKRADDSFNYSLLSRLQSDNNYFLGAANGYEGCLWAGNVEDQIAKMRELYNLVPEKPEWISEEDINNYERDMLEMKGRRANKEASMKSGMKKTSSYWMGAGWYEIGFSDGSVWTNNGPLWIDDLTSFDDEMSAAFEHASEYKLPYADFLGDGNNPSREASVKSRKAHRKTARTIGEFDTSMTEFASGYLDERENASYEEITEAWLADEDAYSVVDALGDSGDSSADQFMKFLAKEGYGQGDILEAMGNYDLAKRYIVENGFFESPIDDAQ